MLIEKLAAAISFQVLSHPLEMIAVNNSSCIRLLLELPFCCQREEPWGLFRHQRGFSCDQVNFASSAVAQVWGDHRWQPQSPVQAAPLESPPELLQGAEGAGGGAPEQPPGEPHAVQQTPQARQHHQPRE